MRIYKTRLKGVIVIKPHIFRDFRGEYIETYNKSMYRESGIDIAFVQDDISVSKKNVLRGIHGDKTTWKLISCLWGAFYFVVVNCDASSRDFGKWQSFTLSDRNRRQVLVPPRHGNAHLALSDWTIFHYKQSTYYNRSKQFTYAWNDPRFGIRWPIRNPVLSERDGWVPCS